MQIPCLPHPTPVTSCHPLSLPASPKPRMHPVLLVLLYALICTHPYPLSSVILFLFAPKLHFSPWLGLLVHSSTRPWTTPAYRGNMRDAVIVNPSPMDDRHSKDFTLTSSPKFSINVYINWPEGIIGYERVPCDLSPLREKR